MIRYLALVALFSSALFAQSLPRSFRVGKQLWTIAPRRFPMVMNEMNITGYTDCERHRIYLEVPHAPNDLAEVLLHEVMHAATGCASDITDEHGGMHGAIWEIAEPLQEILAENPPLARYVCQRRK